MMKSLFGGHEPPPEPKIILGDPVPCDGGTQAALFKTDVVAEMAASEVPEDLASLLFRQFDGVYSKKVIQTIVDFLNASERGSLEQTLRDVAALRDELAALDQQIAMLEERRRMCGVHMNERFLPYREMQPLLDRCDALEKALQEFIPKEK